MTTPASPTLDTPSASAPPIAPPADVDEDWTTTGPKKGIRLRLPAIAAIVAAVALLGIGTGATLKGRSASTTAGTSAGATAGQGGTGQGRPAGAGGRPTTGTVTKVDGTTIQLTDSSGALVTVTVPAGATITADKAGAVGDITVGSTIAVVGTTANGTTTAQAVTINPTGIGAGAAGGPGAGTAPTGP